MVEASDLKPGVIYGCSFGKYKVVDERPVSEGIPEREVQIEAIDAPGMERGETEWMTASNAMTTDLRLIVPEYDEIDIEDASVITGIQYTEGTEFREYDVPPEELPIFLSQVNDPETAEQLITVNIDRSD